MPITRACCIICGSRIEDETFDPPWLGRFRAIYASEEEPLVARLSGLGLRQQFADVVRLCPTATHSESGPVDIWLMRTDLSSTSLAAHPAADPSIWGFPFHAACWRIMEKVCSPGTPDVQSAFDLCRSFPVQLGIMNWGHDYGGSVGYHYKPAGLAPGEELQFVYPINTGSQCRDPLDIPEIRDVFEDQDRDNFDRGPAIPPQRHITTGYQDDFSRLPIEILQLILIYLPTPDVGTLKRASRIYANLHLHDQFWKSRFYRGYELDFAFEGKRCFPLVKGCWRSIYFSIKDLRGKPSVINRRRLWLLSSSLQDLLLRATETKCDGSLSDAHFLGADVRWATANSTLIPHDKSFTLGSRLLYKRVIAVPDNTTAVFISTIAVSSRRYISGIRVQQRDGESFSLGYRHPQDEVLLLLGCDQERLRIVGFHLAQDQHGIRGLSVITDTGALSEWAGEYRDIPRRRLVSSSAGQDIVQGLQGGFDATKLVSLSVASQTGLEAELAFRDKTLWFPDIPQPHLRFLGTEQIRPCPEGLPLSVAVFGDPQGQDLNYLLCLTVFLLDYETVLAVEVTFSGNRPPVRFGMFDTSDGIEKLEFAIDGMGGERVISVEVSNTKQNAFHGFRITTNRGRTAEFPPLALQKLPRGGWQTKSTEPEGGMLVGFWARMASSPRSSSHLSVS
ncbi:hypothetical protein C8A00DRAFT_13823 [Chaetomidium leptoderma]|uniref:F-box domain-containing protein n=1 Tax=Chaetomidium leptoderma TaxID=669021 RepID=A0AAN6VPT3_9PEZI|nr:hypothetical protein C8A00DRAFT_13823 [Chaetomidium leptoderma]